MSDSVTTSPGVLEGTAGAIAVLGDADSFAQAAKSRKELQSTIRRITHLDFKPDD